MFDKGRFIYPASISAIMPIENLYIGTTERSKYAYIQRLQDVYGMWRQNKKKDIVLVIKFDELD
jgi:hypothetical protein